MPTEIKQFGNLKFNKNLFKNSTAFIDVIWAIDVRTEEVYVLHSKISPATSQKIITLEEAQERVCALTPAKEKAMVRESYTVEHLKQLKEETKTTKHIWYDGVKQTFLEVRTPELDSEGNTVKVYASLHNVQKQIDIKLELDRYLSAVTCGIIQYKKNTNQILYANKTALDLLGYESVELLQADGFDGIAGTVNQEDKVAIHHQIDQCLKNPGDKAEFEYRVRFKDGQERIYMGTAILINEDGKEPIVQRSIIDVTKSHENSNLEKKRSQDLEKALATAEQANKAKTQFLNNMSHDIRTPMNAIVGYSYLATTHMSDMEAVASYLSKIKTSSDHLLSLINDMLDMSRIEAGKVTLHEEEISIKKVLKDIESIMMPEIEKKNLHFSTDTKTLNDDLIWCDKLRLNQILINCISNAVKFTPKDGKVSVIVSQDDYYRPGFGSYIIYVKDTGIGMSEEFARHIFEPFERERTSTVSGIQGTGLGMTITKKLTEMMGGTIAVNSIQGVGTTFKFNFSFRIASKLPKRNDSAQFSFSKPKNLKGIKILLVEDNDMNREIAEMILEETGAKVESVTDGKYAVERMLEARPDQYDVILMDIQMPLIDGYQATKIIRNMSNKQIANIPIIALSANALKEDRDKSLSIGMNAHIAKPFEASEVIETIATIIAGRKSTKFNNMGYFGF